MRQTFQRFLLLVIAVCIAGGAYQFWHAGSLRSLGAWCMGWFQATPPYALPQVSAFDPLPGTPVQALSDIVAERRDYTVTALADGRVLFAGDSGEEHPGLEVFDPATGKVDVPGQLPLPALHGRDLLLPDGRVLLLSLLQGEETGARLFDPASGKISAAGNALVERDGYTATLLKNGKVLVVGGTSVKAADGASLASAELYDPARARFGATGSLNLPRSKHSATLLADGKVLIAGGNGPTGQVEVSAELYDPATGQFTLTGQMEAARIEQNAVLLKNGKVLLVGGYVGHPAGSKEAATQGEPVGAELYDPASGKFSAASNFSMRGDGYSVTPLPDGTALVAGGTDDEGHTLYSAELYDPATNAFSATGDMAESRSQHEATLLPDGSVLISGGMQDFTGQDDGQQHEDTLQNCERYDPKSHTFVPAPAMQMVRMNHTAMLLKNGRVLMEGGVLHAGPQEGADEMIESYDPAKGGTLLTAQYVGGRSAHTATLLADGRVLISGGGYGDYILQDAMLVDPVNSTVVPAGSMEAGRAGAAAVLLADGRVLIAGGLGGGHGKPTQDSAELYDPKTNTFTPTGQMNQARSGHSMQLLPDGRVLVVGGWRIGPRTADPSTTAELESHGAKRVLRTAATGGGPSTAAYIAGLDGKLAVTSAEIYDPGSGSFSAAPAPSTARDGASLTVLKDGHVLVAGGATSPASAELYDPAKRTFVATGDLTTPRSGHSATLLADGRVLLAGSVAETTAFVPAGMAPGTDSLHADATAEIYDPVSGGFIGSFRFAKLGQLRHVLALKNNKLLVTGEAGAALFDMAQLPVAAKASAGSLQVLRAGAFSTTGDMLQERSGHSATLLADGQVLVVGGRAGVAAGLPNGATQNADRVLNNAELYDPRAGSFRDAGTNIVGRYNHSATLLKDGRVLIAGGIDQEGRALDTAELYNPKTGRFEQAGKMHDHRVLHSATLLPGGRVLIAGGWGLRSAELYDPEKNTFELANQMLGIHQAHGAVLLPDDQVLIAGGNAGGGIPVAAEIFNPGSGQFAAPRSEDPRYGSDADGANGSHGEGKGPTLLPNALVLMPGADKRRPRHPVLFDPIAQSYTPLAEPLSCPVEESVLLGDGRVLLLQDGGPLCQGAALYSNRNQSIRNTAIEPQARINPTATLLADGRVLITGGRFGPMSGREAGTPAEVKRAEIFDPEQGAVLVYPERKLAAPGAMK